MKHPIQKPVLIKEVIRFTENKIVSAMLDKLGGMGYTLNEISRDFRNDSPEDYDQLLQLIGYSVSGVPVRDESIRDAAYEMYENGSSESESRATIAEEKLRETSKSIREGVALLYNIHPDDLEEL